MTDEMMNKIDSILKQADAPDRHTFFQIEKFIIGKEPTSQSQLWAIVRELQARKETVATLNKDLADAEDNLDLLDIRIERLNRSIRAVREPANTETSDLDISECEINIRKLLRDKQYLIEASRKVNKKLKSVMEEMQYLLEGYEVISSKHGPLKPLDDAESQKELWNEKLLEEFNLRLILGRPFDPEFIRTVMALDDDAQVKKQVVAFIERQQRNMIGKQASLPQVQPKAKTIAGNLNGQ